MNWQYYTVTFWSLSDYGTIGERTVSVRGISKRDAEYVALNPCKRNNNKQLVREGEHVHSVEVAA